MTTAAVGLGANLGDAQASVRRALGVLDLLPGTRLTDASKLYRSAPWGQVEQPDFINAVAILDTRLDARALLDRLLRIERDFGRVRVADERWGPRTLDLDLLLFGDEQIEETGLRVPHPHLHERAFALLPLAAIAPAMVIPAIGVVGALAAAMATDGVQALP